MAVTLTRKLWTVDEYEEMIEKGILDEDDRVELIRGEIVKMAAIGPRHATCIRRLEKLFYGLLDEAGIVSGQNPIRLPNDSEPEPDVALLRQRVGDYVQTHPTVEDVYLVVEVAVSTLATDRSEKIPMYAEAGIVEAWIVSLEEDVIEVYSNPDNGEYKTMRVAQRGETIALPASLPGVVSVDEVLG